ncbi:hypothetical protein [Phocicoccus pinnipedialis]|uniref:Glucosamine-6-phosphate deaminase n=1 Tax=Phocicoccus pinnipedialis TaxID=110845 RepID=A0A6V7RMZ6_9BACL|nr:hypothetical protein [Jeotgalicoccus pinnipedialis]MBP1939615.1 hypothetical protein [Jeotgalicoccus pinnipedialis]CAD2078984.1 Glucosamine-6-phosphate deaminase [Jeotgalicoccus pinnipedialis]
MALNFKIFNTKDDADFYLADIIRKQLNKDPHTVLALDLNDKLSDTYDKFLANSKSNTLNLANTKLFLLNSAGKSKFNQLQIPESQIKNVSDDTALSNGLDKKEKINVALLNLDDHSRVGFKQSDDQEQLLTAKELFIYASGIDAAEAVLKLYNADLSTSGSLSDIKKHRMVTVVLDQEAASRLDTDFREYYTYKFA